MKPFPTLKKLTAYSVCLLTLAACETYEGLRQDIDSVDFGNFQTASSVSSNDQTSNFLLDGDCPQIEIVGELSMLNEFTNNNTLISSVDMTEAKSTCQHGERSVTVDLQLAFDGALGPAGRANNADQPFFTYPFFVAVTSSSGKILAKEVFAASINYEAGQNSRRYVETLRQIIPADTRAQGARYKVMIGFQLTKDQLTYNRGILEQKRIADEKAEKVAMEQAQQEVVIEKVPAPAPAQTPTQGVKIDPAPTTNRAGPIDITTP